MTKIEWIEKSDDEKAYPFVVLYTNREVFPPSNYFATKEEAIAQLGGARGVQCVAERRFTKGVGSESKLIVGAWPAYNFSK